jgi:ribosomal protein L37AE/L43A
VPDTEKYGVEEVENAEKLAEENLNTCPRCRSKLRPRDVTGILLCLKCGTLPFEATDHGTPKSR